MPPFLKHSGSRHIRHSMRGRSVAPAASGPSAPELVGCEEEDRKGSDEGGMEALMEGLTIDDDGSAEEEEEGNQEEEGEEGNGGDVRSDPKFRHSFRNSIFLGEDGFRASVSLQLVLTESISMSGGRRKGGDGPVFRSLQDSVRESVSLREFLPRMRDVSPLQPTFPNGCTALCSSFFFFFFFSFFIIFSSLRAGFVWGADVRF